MERIFLISLEIRRFWPKTVRQARLGELQNLDHHRHCESSGLGVLPTRMIAAEKRGANSGWMVHCAVPKRVVPLCQCGTLRNHRRQVGVERQAAQNEHGPQALQVLNLPPEKVPAGPEFGWNWPVLRGCAAHSRGDVAVLQHEAISGGGGSRLRGEARRVEGTVQKVARTVAREDTSRAVRPVGSRRQSNQQQSCLRIAERRNGPAPVFPVSIGLALDGRHPPAVLEETRAALARYDLGRDGGQRRRFLRGGHGSRSLAPAGRTAVAVRWAARRPAAAGAAGSLSVWSEAWLHRHSQTLHECFLPDHARRAGATCPIPAKTA